MEGEKSGLSEEMLRNRTSYKYQSQDSAIGLFLKKKNPGLFGELFRLKTYIMDQ